MRLKLLLLIVSVFLMVLLSSCGTYNELGEQRAPVIFTVDSITLRDGAGGLVYVDEDTSALVAKADQADITLQNRPKNPNQASGSWLAIKIKEYQVTFYRTDGGNAVPNSLKSKMNYTIEFGTQLTVENMIILSGAEKFKSPLWDLAVNGEDLETGNITINCDVFIEFFGEVVSGETVYASGWTHIEWGSPIQE